MTRSPVQNFRLSAPIVDVKVLELSYSRPGAGGIVNLQADEGLRGELFERSGRGELVELEMHAQTFAQGPGVRIRAPFAFSEAGLESFAVTAPGTPVQFNHSLLDTDCGGHCLTSEMHLDGETLQLHERLLLNTQRSVQSALARNMRKFSIHFEWFRDAVLCSVCNAGFARCEHYPGQRLGDTVVVMVVTKTVAIERSHVMFPAVDQTGPLSISRLAALAGATFEDQNMDISKIAEALGLGGEASLTACVTEAERLRAEYQTLRAAKDTVEQQLAAARGALAVAENERDTAQAALVAQQAESRQADLEETITQLRAEGRLLPGDGGRVALLRKWHAEGRDQDVAENIALWRSEPALVPVQAAHPQLATPGAVGNAAGNPLPMSGQGSLSAAQAFARLPPEIRSLAAHIEDKAHFLRTTTFCAQYNIPYTGGE